MSSRTKQLLIIAGCLAAALFPFVASAQVTPSNLFHITPSSTIVPNNASLTIPCTVISNPGCGSGGSTTTNTIVGGVGNSVSSTSSGGNTTSTVTNTGVTSLTGSGCVTNGGNATGSVTLGVTCGTSNVSTSSPNNWSLLQSFNGITNTGGVTSTLTFYSNGTSSSYIAVLNHYIEFPTAVALAAGAPCGNATGVTDAATCIDDWYAANTQGATSTASTTVVTDITLPPGQIYNYSAQGIDATSSEMLVLSCGAGSADIFNYIGATSTPAVWIDSTSYGGTYDQVAGSEIDNCLFNTTNSTGTLIRVGGTNVTPHVRFNNVVLHGPVDCLNLASNTYDFEATNIIETDCAPALLVNSASNSGEGIKFFNPWWADPANSTSSNCIVLSNSSVSDFEVLGGSKDSCGGFVGTGNLQVSIGYMHDEDSESAFMPPYFRWTMASDGNLVSHISLDHIAWVLDNPTSSAHNVAALVNCGSVCDAENSSLALGGSGGGIAAFMTNTANTNAIETVNNINIPSLAIASNTLNFEGILPVGGIFTSTGNSYVGGCSETSGNIYQCINNGNSLGTDVSGGVRLNTNEPPTISCTSGSATLTNAGDSAGWFTNTSSTPSCTIVFSTPFAFQPTCGAWVESGTVQTYGALDRTTSTVISGASAIPAGTITQFICIGR